MYSNIYGLTYLVCFLPDLIYSIETQIFTKRNIDKIEKPQSTMLGILLKRLLHQCRKENKCKGYNNKNSKT